MTVGNPEGNSPDVIEAVDQAALEGELVFVGGVIEETAGQGQAAGSKRKEKRIR